MHQTAALLIKRYPLSETSLIIVWLTEQYGKIKTTAQGARKRSGPFSGRLELFARSEISFSLNKKSDLHFLKEVVPVVAQHEMPSSYLTLLCASYFSELCDLFTESWDPVPEIFGLLERALHFLQQQKPTLRAVEYFEVSLAKALGIYAPGLPVEHSLGAVVTNLPANRRSLLKLLSVPAPSPKLLTL